jgi:hypothetical protein
MRKFFAVAMGSFVALVGFASTANASSTVDLVWIDVTTTATSGAVICLRAAKRDCPQLGTTTSSVLASDSITLGVILTAGPSGSAGGGVSVEYDGAIPSLVVDHFVAVTTTQPFFYLPQQLGVTADTGTTIDNINAAADIGLGLGIGMPPGTTAYLGTVTFHTDQVINGTHEIVVGINGPTDDLLRRDGTLESGLVFNSAFVVNVPEPGALSLLVMGLGGMLLAGRGRRS